MPKFPVKFKAVFEGTLQIEAETQGKALNALDSSGMDVASIQLPDVLSECDDWDNAYLKFFVPRKPQKKRKKR
jgi:hypothetical protein